jgi:thiopurine S-methyltransferase
MRHPHRVTDPGKNARASWEKRWSEGQTRFHETTPNELLVAQIARFERESGKLRILVPLAGKTFDVRWLAERGHEVVGVEFVASAVEAFFTEWGVIPERVETSTHPTLRHGSVTMVIADFLDVTPEALGVFDVVYDRAAIVAVEPTLREAYVATSRAFLAPEGDTLLVALGYDQSKGAGPPFSVDEAELTRLYAPAVVEVLATQAAPASPRLVAAGVETFAETTYRIQGASTRIAVPSRFERTSGERAKGSGRAGV